MQALNAIGGLAIPVLTYITTTVLCYANSVKTEDALVYGLWCGGLLLGLAGCCWLFSYSGRVLAKREKQNGLPPCGLAPTVLEAIILQSIIVLLFALTLDRGVLFQACYYADIGYWVGVGIIVLRRRNRLTRTDYFYLRWAWLPVIVFGTAGFYNRWKFLGLI